jgi:MMP 1-O-methyltransferase
VNCWEPSGPRVTGVRLTIPPFPTADGAVGETTSERPLRVALLSYRSKPHGSEENQPGWEWHDESLVDPATGRLETLPSLRHTLHEAKLEDAVTVVVGDTKQVARWWETRITFLFLDGNHTEAIAQHDYEAFARHLAVGGLMAVHDVFPDPADGGQPPWHVVQRALASGSFAQIGETGSLRILCRLAATPI